MRLLQVIESIEGIASRQPSVKMIVRNDVRRLNTIPDLKYGIFVWTQGQHSASVDSDVMTFQFSFFYIDRLKADKGNLVEVQSEGISVLDNIIRSLEEVGIYPSSYNFTTFSQRFMDECGGVFCGVSLDVPISNTCPEDFTLQDGTIVM